LTGVPRPLLFGYLRVPALAKDVGPAEVRSRFGAFADTEGYALGAVFVDQAHTAPAGFDALIEAVKTYDAHAVAVPSLDHLAVLGTSATLTAFLQRVTGARVLVVGEPSR